MEQVIANWWTPSPPETEEEDEEEHGRPCHVCGENIPASEPAVMLYIVVGFNAGGEDQRFIVYEDDDFKYPPLLIDEDCWNAIVEEVGGSKTDEPPVRMEGEYTRCVCCDSTIREGEEFACAKLGELHISPRCPSGEEEYDFFEYGKHADMCFSCAELMDQLVEESDD